MLDRLEYWLFETNLSTYFSVAIIVLNALVFAGQVVRAIFF
jgi:hypothetical protein